MSIDLFVRYFHFVGIFVVFACLVAEHLLIEKQMTRAQIKRVSSIDAVYGFAALVVLTTGLLLWLAVGKGSAFYNNPIFHTKVTLFVVIGILSIYPTLFFIKNRRGDASEQVALPKAVIMLIRVELLIIVSMPALAVLIARGIGIIA